MRKKGASQIDWAISMGVFLIFMTIFIILIHPVFYPETAQSSLIDQLTKKFTDVNEPNHAVWKVNKLPLYVQNILNEMRAVALELPYSWSTENTSFIDNRQFMIDESKIFCAVSFFIISA